MHEKMYIEYMTLKNSAIHSKNEMMVFDSFWLCYLLKPAGKSLDVRPLPQGPSINTPERREPLQVSQEQPITDTSRGNQLRFHAHCGENVELQKGGQVASRTNPYDEFTGATVLTSRPLRPGEMFELTVGLIIDTWSGSLQMGEQL